MKKLVKFQSPAKLKALLLTILLVSCVSAFSTPASPLSPQCIIDGLQRSGPNQGVVVYSWSAVYGASEYKAFYVRVSDNYVSSVRTVSSPYIDFNLPPGLYHVYFAPVCGSSTLEYIEDEVLIL